VYVLSVYSRVCMHVNGVRDVLFFDPVSPFTNEPKVVTVYASLLLPSYALA